MVELAVEVEEFMWHPHQVVQEIPLLLVHLKEMQVEMDHHQQVAQTQQLAVVEQQQQVLLLLPVGLEQLEVQEQPLVLQPVQ